jgi:hypothetical protein
MFRAFAEVAVPLPKNTHSNVSNATEPGINTSSFQLTPGAFIFEHVCVIPGDRPIVLLYDMEIPKMGAAQLIWVGFENRSSTEWHRDSMGGIWQPETLFFKSFSNPNHCFFDNLLSIYVDATDRGLFREGPAYPSFWSPTPYLVTSRDWCSFTALGLHLITERTQAVVNITKQKLVCFRRLVVPRYMEYRFPMDGEIDTAGNLGLKMLERRGNDIYNFSRKFIIKQTMLDDMRTSLYETILGKNSQR